MAFRISGMMGTPRAASHFEASIDRPVPYRCSTAAKISAVAAAISVAISHSSRWSSARLNTLSTKFPHLRLKRPGADHSRPFSSCVRQSPSVHLNVEFLGEYLEHFWPDATLGPRISRTHGGLPGFALI